HFENFEAQSESAGAALSAEPTEGQQPWEPSWALSPAEKYDVLMRDESYSMTKEGWTVYEDYQDYEHDWSWMGHCHGWAAAAYLEQAPAASVVADIDGQQVLFTEGDIRGLLTKAWASSSTSEGTSFMGTRCNARTIIRDDLGRIVDGTVYEPNAEQPKEAVTDSAKTIYIKRNFWGRYNLLTYSESIDSDEEKVLQATASAEKPESSFVVNTYASIADYRAQQVESEQIFVYNKECRDTNAGSFHLVLVQYLSDRIAPEAKRGFVMDVTREDQVWNQPVYGFESTIESVENIEDIDDPLKDFRAEGTVQIATVTTDVHYALEKGPYVDYDETNGSKITSKKYRYTLEIDADGWVIGGEWQVDPHYYNASSAPDFLWAPQGELMDSADVKYSAIKRIHECSLNVDQAREVTTPKGNAIQVVDCSL
ncbi:MAG: hypothetical protein JRI68_19785, partial [Deltaproteobacteria bacterium]|nr:hypothetical protein [Deltaproteobacteria bacterium]